MKKVVKTNLEKLEIIANALVTDVLIYLKEIVQDIFIYPMIVLVKEYTFLKI